MLCILLVPQRGHSSGTNGVSLYSPRWSDFLRHSRQGRGTSLPLRKSRKDVVDARNGQDRRCLMPLSLAPSTARMPRVQQPAATDTRVQASLAFFPSASTPRTACGRPFACSPSKDPEDDGRLGQGNNELLSSAVGNDTLLGRGHWRRFLCDVRSSLQSPLGCRLLAFIVGEPFATSFGVGSYRSGVAPRCPVRWTDFIAMRVCLAKYEISPWIQRDHIRCLQIEEPESILEPLQYSYRQQYR